MENLSFSIGMLFGDASEFRKAVRGYGIRKHKYLSLGGMVKTRLGLFAMENLIASGWYMHLLLMKSHFKLRHSMMSIAGDYFLVRKIWHLHGWLIPIT